LQPSHQVYARVSLNVVGNAAQNRLHPLYYENRAKLTPDLQHLAVYQAELKIDQRWFSLEGYYRTGHYHLGAECDLCGLYRFAYYGPNLDIYNGNAPFGAVLSGHRAFEGFKLAIGPELY